MDLAIRNKWVSFGGSSVVKDLEERDVFKVQGMFFTLTRKKLIQTMNGETKFMVRNKFWRLFAYKALVYDPNGEEVASISRKVFSMHDKYLVTSKFGNLEIKGDIFTFNYKINLNGKEVGSISRKFSLRDSFVLHLENDENAAFYLALVIAVDNITDQRQANRTNH